MMLAAWELGIGSVPATVYEHDLARRLLGYPETHHCEYILSFGYPAESGRPHAPRTSPAAAAARRHRPRRALVAPDRRELADCRHAPGGRHCQRKKRAETPKHTTSQPASTATQTQSGANGVPSTITWRSASPR